jgi:predicted component of type VI protein secretion system
MKHKLQDRPHLIGRGRAAWPEEADNSESYLEILNGPNIGKILRLNKERVTIGRNADADFPLEDISVARFHAQVIREGGVWFVGDLQSRNGTYVNGHVAVSRVQLRDGDKIHIGQSMIRFRTSIPTGTAVLDATPLPSPTVAAGNTANDLDADAAVRPHSVPVDDDFVLADKISDHLPRPAASSSPRTSVSWESEPSHRSKWLAKSRSTRGRLSLRWLSIGVVVIALVTLVLIGVWRSW